ncbi:hypothetical protein F511_41170 [Dorcoceras hygrometricum]|uniref:Uncharacterized protein n=1 Tax=Dorcoceras hygrometricum TaxID=472368 RepID=A0A2Z7B5V2_9LAMI|nr:hypothetical protein F511_41170 [Dorcoceras hygrometricum]
MARPCRAAHVGRIIAQASARPAACVGHQIVRPALPIVGEHVTTARPARDLRLAIARPERDGVTRAIALARQGGAAAHGGGRQQLGTFFILGKWVFLVTLAMSLFGLQDVCIAIGSLATLDLPMVVDLIGIHVLKRPYYTLTTTDWFLQILSVIPRGSWGDVARRFTMIRWASTKL